MIHPAAFGSVMDLMDTTESHSCGNSEYDLNTTYSSIAEDDTDRFISQMPLVMAN
jgi:hypothetical protein